MRFNEPQLAQLWVPMLRYFCDVDPIGHDALTKYIYHRVYPPLSVSLSFPASTDIESKQRYDAIPAREPTFVISPPREF